MSHVRFMMVLLGLSLVMAATGCASGPKFERVTNIPDGQGVIYIYRSASPVGCAVQPLVSVAGKGTVGVSPGGYTYAMVPAGEAEVTSSTEATSSVTVAVKSREERFVRETIGVGFFVGRPELVEVPAETALHEIQSTHFQKY